MSASSASWVTSTVTPRKSARWRAELDPQGRGHADVEAGERLVEQQQVGVGRQGARDRDPLGLAAGQLGRAGGRRGAPMPSRSSQSLRRSASASRLVRPRERGPNATLSRALRCGNSRWSWKTTPDVALAAASAAAGRRRRAGAWPSARDQAGERVDEGALAGAVRTDHRDHVAGLGGRARRRARSGTIRSRLEPASRAHGVPSQRSRRRDQDRDRDDQHHQAQRERGVGVGLAGDVDQRRHRLGACPGSCR